MTPFFPFQHDIMASFFLLSDDVIRSFIHSRWFVDGEIVPGNHGAMHTISKIGRSFHNEIVKCEVNNVIGKSEETETLDVHCESLVHLKVLK